MVTCIDRDKTCEKHRLELSYVSILFTLRLYLKKKMLSGSSVELILPGFMNPEGGKHWKCMYSRGQSVGIQTLGHM